MSNRSIAKAALAAGPGVRALNPDVFKPWQQPGLGEIPKAAPEKRIRQDSKPVMNKLEAEWYSVIKSKHPHLPIHAQALKLQIANGAFYKPDFFCTSWPDLEGHSNPTAWEVKGPKQMKGVARGMIVLKTAAHQWPEIAFVLVWKQDGRWMEQRVLP